MRTDPVIKELAAVPALVSIGDALDYASIKTLPARLPAAWVIADGFTAGHNRYGAVKVDQRLEDSFMVVVALPIGREKVPDSIHLVTGAVIDALVGWVHPDSGGLPTEIVSGSVLDADATSYTFALRFRTASHIRKDLRR